MQTITLWLPGGCSLGHDQHLHVITCIGMLSDCAATTEHFIVWVSGDH